MPWLLAFAIAGLALGGPATGASADDVAQAPAAEAARRSLHRCPDSVDVVVQAVEHDDARTACDGVARALAFLARAGIEPPAETTIDIVQDMPGDLRGRAVGCYLRASRNILLLEYRSFEAGGTWFRVPVDRELYRAVAAHEMAHAVIGCHAGTQGLPVAAHEYVAYVVLFATMEPALRQRLLAKFPGTGFDNSLQINDINHIVDPNQFGVDAWRHYLRQPGRQAWLLDVIAGRVVQEMPREGP